MQPDRPRPEQGHRLGCELGHRRRDGGRLSAPRVAHECHAIHVDEPVERRARIGVPGAEQVEVLEQQPGPDRRLEALVIATEEPVEDGLVHRRDDEPPAGEVLAEVGVAGLGVVAHRVVAVDDQDEREGPGALRVPDERVEPDRLHAASEVPADEVAGG